VRNLLERERGIDRANVQIHLREGDFDPGFAEGFVDRQVQLVNRRELDRGGRQEAANLEIERAIAETQLLNLTQTILRYSTVQTELHGLLLEWLPQPGTAMR
jgi:hypothetical protein